MNELYMKSTALILLSLASLSCGHASIFPVERVYPSEIADRPPLEAQHAAAVTLIADSILSPEFTTAAVVQSRKDTFPRIDAARRKHYGIQDDADILGISKIIMALNMAPVYRVEAIYAAADLPPILAAIQDEMFDSKAGGSHAPLNFRPSLFPFDNTVWLAFLKRDSVFNYKMRPRTGSFEDRDFINNVLTNQTTAAGLQQGLMMEGVLSETNQFSLVQPYANFPIHMAGIPFVPFSIEGVHIVSDEQTPNPQWSGQDLDLTKELVLPVEFLADLRLIIQYAAAYTPELAQPAMQTPIGVEVLARVRAKLAEGASNAHLHADWIRPPPAP